MLLAKCMQEILRHGKMHFELKFMVMDPGYNPKNLQRIKDNAEKLNIPITIFKSDIFDVVKDIKDSPCYLCARMRRGFLYSHAKSLGCNKIALGHHFDDVIETILLSMLYGAEMKTMMPKLKSTNFEGMELIRPLYYVSENVIKNWRDKFDLKFLACACKLTAGLAKGDTDSARHKTKQIIESLKTDIPDIEDHILKSITNVQVDTMIEYKLQGERHNFLDDFKRDLKD